MQPIFHITSRTEAIDAAGVGEYVPKAFEADRFIHCSYAHQLAQVAERHFRGRTDLVVLEIDPTALSCTVIDENLEGGAELFPHIYGRLPMAAVVRTHAVRTRGDGRFELSADVLGGASFRSPR